MRIVGTPTVKNYAYWDVTETNEARPGMTYPSLPQEASMTNHQKCLVNVCPRLMFIVSHSVGHWKTVPRLLSGTSGTTLMKAPLPFLETSRIMQLCKDFQLNWLSWETCPVGQKVVSPGGSKQMCPALYLSVIWVGILTFFGYFYICVDLSPVERTF